jgi:hypothetical protein
MSSILDYVVQIDDLTFSTPYLLFGNEPVKWLTKNIDKSSYVRKTIPKDLYIYDELICFNDKKEASMFKLIWC